MVFKKLMEKFSTTDDKYEVLYYKYSKLKLENQRLQEDINKSVKEVKDNLHREMANKLIEIYQDIELMKAESFRVNGTDKDTQRLLISISKVDKDMLAAMKDFSIESYSAEERMYDPELHEVASYHDAKGMQKGAILKTSKKGYKYRNEIIKKPKVVVMK